MKLLKFSNAIFIVCITVTNYLSSDVFTDYASALSFCMIYNGEVEPLLRSSSTNLKHYPIYRSLLMIEVDVINTNINSPYPVSVEQLLKFDIVSCDS